MSQPVRDLLVVVSCRPERMAAFWAAWGGGPWDTAVLVCDGEPCSRFEIPSSVRFPVLSTSSADWIREPWSSIGDSAVKSIAFLVAMRYRPEVVHVLDDDCLPEPDLLDDRHPGVAFVAAHRRALFETRDWRATYREGETRGHPYATSFTDRVILNMGLWTEHPDYDGLQRVSRVRHGHVPRNDNHGGETCDEGALSPYASRVLPSVYWPLCAMNVAFRGDRLPLLYFPLQGRGRPYNRMDDIWCGVVLQRVMRRFDLLATGGAPTIRHAQEGSPFAAMAREAAGIRANELFYKIVSAIDLNGAANPHDALYVVGAAFSIWSRVAAAHAAGKPPVFTPTGYERGAEYFAAIPATDSFWAYLGDLGRAYAAWSDACRRVLSSPVRELPTTHAIYR